MRALPICMIVAATTLGVAVATPARAATCDGFADVDAAASYCGAVEWLKDRSITLGCDASNFCPGAAVTRAQMALFMNRLGDVVSPQLLSQTALIGEGILPDGNLFGDCVINLDARSYPRAARLNGTYYGTASTTGVDLRFYYQADLSGLVQGGDITMPLPSPAAAPVTYATSLSLDPDVAYQFVLAPVNGSGAAVAMGESTCALDAIVVNAPDAAPADAKGASLSSHVSRTPVPVTAPRR
jgi:hypothetical protein